MFGAGPGRDCGSRSASIDGTAPQLTRASRAYFFFFFRGAPTPSPPRLSHHPSRPIHSAPSSPWRRRIWRAAGATPCAGDEAAGGRARSSPLRRPSRRPHLPAARIGGEASLVSCEGYPTCTRRTEGVAQGRRRAPTSPVGCFSSSLLLGRRISVLFARGN